jgi:uncharacterized membrane protein (UPF0127 family)
VSFLHPLVAREHVRCALVNDRTGRLVAHDVEAAFDSRTRRMGLLGRDGLQDGQAMILAPCAAIHTCGMRFPIDVLFVSRDGRVLKIVERLAAWRIAASLRALATVELAAGQARRVGLTEGDRLVVRGVTQACTAAPRR